ncbi:MAG: Gfo/Idh/MocA family oxidoreductase [Gemmatimonadota bacterium]|nr:MAG: Gfo/Idh/MocA family oxidoreductase [Gemmatimonadota bacterium]
MTASSNRRDFVKTLALGAAALAPSAKAYARSQGANDRLGIGIIGVGQMARGHLENLLAEQDVEVRALCDVYAPNLEWAAARAPRAMTHVDFREVLDRDDIDAVVVGTPDHWHAIPTVMACEAGKDVYVEKPTAVAIAESRQMIEAARRNDRIVQVGTQQRSAPHFRYAVQLVRGGTLGKVTFVRTWNYRNLLPDGIGNPPDGTPPDDLDWDMWLGPAPSVPYNENRFGVFLDENLQYQRWSSFRWFWDYAGGMMTDWGVHLLDIVQWAMDADAPEKVSSHGGKLVLEDNRQTPDTIQATFRYPGFVCTYENRECSSHPLDGHGYGIFFHGTEATMFLDRGGFQIHPEGREQGVPMQAQSLPASHARHMRNFLDCVKSRQQPVSDIEIGHRSTSTAILGNIAYRTGRQLTWDREAEAIVGDAEAAKLLDLAYRAPWTL